jgi:hypothetical protein
MKRGRPTKKAAEGWRDYNHGICNEHKKINLDLTHADVNNAVERFKKKGGKIKKLPPSGDNFSPKYHSENFRNMRAV